MLDVKVLNMNGEEVGTLSLSEAVFGIEPNTVAMHAAVVNYLANRRHGTQSTKTRTEVRGGGRKPWRQKGTGHARQGSTRAPQWTHGGVALGPKPRSYPETEKISFHSQQKSSQTCNALRTQLQSCCKRNDRSRKPRA